MFDTMCCMGIGGSQMAELHRVLDEMLALAAADLDDATVHDDVIELQVLTARLSALKAARVAEWSRRSLWNTDGSTCASSRLASEAGLAPSAARDEVRRANALGEMPAAAAALAAGDITVAHADLLARANSAGREDDFARDEALLVEDCTTMAFDDAHQAVDYWMLSADEIGAETHAARRHARRGLSWRRERDGALVLRAVLDPVAAVAIDEELHRLEHQLYLTDLANDADASSRTPRQRSADALVDMATRSASTTNSRRPRPLISVLVGETMFAHTCELAAGTVLTPGEIVPLLADADIERIIFEAPDRVISASQRRTFTGALRRAIEIRDRRCTHHSGCRTVASRCDIDHIVAVPDGGVTSYDNGRVLCSTHNRRPDKRNAPPRRRRRRRSAPADGHDPTVDTTPGPSEQIALARQRARALKPGN